MNLRLLHVIVPANRDGDLGEALSELPAGTSWRTPLEGGRVLASIVLSAEQTERLVDALEERFAAVEGFRVVHVPVEATLPRLESERPPEAEPEAPAEPPPLRIARAELYEDLSAAAKVTPVYGALVVLSTIVAAVGMLHGDVAVLIGAMMIAPLLGPNVALCLGTTLGDVGLMRGALRANVVGVALALVVGFALGVVLHVDPHASELARRTSVGLADVALALAAGAAGALAFTTGLPATLVGVMVAVALLPPLVAFALLAGSGDAAPAAGAALLAATNLICVNLAGVVVFYVQGIRPHRWWEANEARRATVVALLLWTTLLAALVALLWVAGSPAWTLEL